MSKKNITIISSLIAFIVIVASGYFFYKNSGQNNIKADHDKYLALINDNHNFDEGVKGLENLDNDKGQKIFKNIKIEIKIAKELKNTNTSLDNKDIDSAKKSLEKVETLTIDNSFDKAIDWLKEDITNYDKVLKEINDAKPDDINTIIDKYKFNHTSLKQKLNDEANKKVSKKEEVHQTENQNTSSTLTFAERIAKNYEYYEHTIKNDLISMSKSPDGKEAPTDGIDVSYRTFDKHNNLIMLNYTARDPQYSAIVLFKLNNDGTCSLVEYGSLQRSIATYKAIY